LLLFEEFNVTTTVVAALGKKRPMSIYAFAPERYLG
jgi:hypothetical protein